MAAVLMLLGALVILIGTALLSLEAAVVVLGVLLLGAGADLARRPGTP